MLVASTRLEDARGWFSETYSAARLAEAGIDCTFPQENQSWSRAAGTLRGLHFQAPPSAQAKLVACLSGRILDCIVDVRAGSPTYGQHLTVELGVEGDQLFVPIGFAHGFITLTPDVLVSYRVSAPYDRASEGGVAWNDPALGIDWPLRGRDPVVSEKDALLKPLHALDSPFVYSGAPLALTRI